VFGNPGKTLALVYEILHKELDLLVMSFGKVFQILVDLIVYDCWYVAV
jgi:hypothetical protein